MTAIVLTKEFSPKAGTGVKEYHSFIRMPQAGMPFGEQMEAVVDALDGVAAERKVRFVRFFLSDAANQQPALSEAMASAPYPVSYIQQPPLDGTKLAAWVYSTDDGASTMDLVWDAYMSSSSEGSLAQMSDIFVDYGQKLQKRGLSVAQDCIRTWIYVHDVDVNYGGVVKGRKDYFNTIGLTPDTHFIASTGIEGRHPEPLRFVTMDAVAARGLKPGQIQYLYAKDHLSPTADYGVTFERGTAVHFEDRTHAYISGTASIDSKGQVLHPGDVRKQTLRMLENIEALLSETSAGLGDIVMAVVYLRDTADYLAVKSIIDENCPGLNAEFVLAPVCRPAWLVEMECIAII
ncbi:MAG: Rid family hydrolase [Bacteroidales bacterium]|nr:Rid family hydrolase [Bacteroidales bacterium]